MKKHAKKLMAVLMAVMCLCLSVQAAVPVNLSENAVIDVEPRFVAIAEAARELTLENSLGKLYCMGYTNVYSDYTAGVTVELQKLGSTWFTIKTWTATSTTDFAYVEEYYYVTDGSYRIKATHRAYNGNIVAETFVGYSDVVDYKS